MIYNPTIVRAAIADPANAGKSSGEIAALFAPVSGFVPIDLAQVDSYLQAQGIKQPLIRLRVNASTPQPLADGLADFLDRVSNPKHFTLDYSDTKIRQDITTLLATLLSAPVAALMSPAGVFTQAHADAIAAMGTAQTFPAGGAVSAADVDAEKLGMASDGLRAWLKDKFTAALGTIDAAQRSGTATTQAALAAIFNS
jgi:hypothetical protein